MQTSVTITVWATSAPYLGPVKTEICGEHNQSASEPVMDRGADDLKSLARPRGKIRGTLHAYLIV